MKYKSDLLIIKVIIFSVLMIVDIILAIADVINVTMSFLILILCLIGLILYLYCFVKTSIVIDDDKITLSYYDSINFLNFNKYINITIKKEEILCFEKKLDKNKATPFLYIKTNSNEYKITNIFGEQRINKIIDTFKNINN